MVVRSKQTPAELNRTFDNLGIGGRGPTPRSKETKKSSKAKKSERTKSSTSSTTDTVEGKPKGKKRILHGLRSAVSGLPKPKRPKIGSLPKPSLPSLSGLRSKRGSAAQATPKAKAAEIGAEVRGIYSQVSAQDFQNISGSEALQGLIRHSNELSESSKSALGSAKKRGNKALKRELTSQLELMKESHAAGDMHTTMALYAAITNHERSDAFRGLPAETKEVYESIPFMPSSIMRITDNSEQPGRLPALTSYLGAIEQAEAANQDPSKFVEAFLKPQSSLPEG